MFNHLKQTNKQKNQSNKQKTKRGVKILNWRGKNKIFFILIQNNFYMGNPQELIKLISELVKDTKWKVDTQNLIVFLYISSQKLEEEILKIPAIITSNP